MDEARFDALTLTFGRGVSRRCVLHGLTGLAAVGLGQIGHPTADALICRHRGVLCAKDAQCCSGASVDYHCTCPAAAALCDRTCVDLTAGAQNCGGRGQTCAAGDICRGGTCAARYA